MKDQSKISILSAETRVEIEKEEQKRSFFDRYFSPLKEGSLRGAIFTLLASAMGTGIFNLPLRVAQIGFFPFIIFVAIGCLFSSLGMVLILRLIRRHGIKSYGQMCKKAYGKGFKRLAQFCIIIYPWGVTICFQVIFAKFICQILNDTFGIQIYEDTEDTIYTNSGNLIRIFINIGSMGIMIIFALQKKIDFLQKLAIVGVLAVIFNVTCIILIAFTGFSRPDDQYDPYQGIFHANLDNVKWWTQTDKQSISQLFQGLSSILFCFVNHQLLFPLTTTLKRPNKKRHRKIIIRSHIVELIFYILLGIMAYLLLLEHQDIHPIAAMVITSIPTLPLTIGKFLMVFALFFAVPLNIFPARQSIFEAFSMKRTNKNHIFLTVGLTISSTILAILFQSVNSYFGLLGGTAGVLMSAGLPSISYFKLTKRMSKKDVFILIFVTIVTLSCFTGAILSVIDMN